MKSNEYKRAVRVTLSPVKVAKQGIRLNINKAAKVNIGHAVAGVVSEVLEFQSVLLPYLTGAQQLTPAMKTKARPEFGDLLYYIAVGARDLKVKLPTSTKKVKLPGTITEQVMALTHIAMNLSSAQKKQYYGQELDMNAIKSEFELLILQAWGISLSVFGAPPAEVMDENITKLKARYPEAQWSLEHVVNKNHENEAKAVEDSKVQAA